MKKLILLAFLVLATLCSIILGIKPGCEDYFRAVLGSFSTDHPMSNANKVIIDEFAGQVDRPRSVFVGGKEMSLMDALDYMTDHCGDSHEVIWNPTGEGTGVMVRRSGSSNLGFNFTLPDVQSLGNLPLIISGTVALFGAIFLFFKRFAS